LADSQLPNYAKYHVRLTSAKFCRGLVKIMTNQEQEYN
jgi:hypothetical protein